MQSDDKGLIKKGSRLMYWLVVVVWFSVCSAVLFIQSGDGHISIIFLCSLIVAVC